MNSISIKMWRNSAWRQVSGTLVYPISIGRLLDERLDETYITLYNSTVNVFDPTTLFRITVDGIDHFAIVADDNAVELPYNSGRYKHELYLVEPTKLTEGVICQSLTFTNALSLNAAEAFEYAIVEPFALGANPDKVNGSWESLFRNGFYSGMPGVIRSDFTPLSPDDFASRIAAAFVNAYIDPDSVTVTIGHDNYYSYVSVDAEENETVVQVDDDASPSINFYSIKKDDNNIGKLFYYSEIKVTMGVTDTIYRYACHIPFLFEKISYSKLPYSITDAVCRCLELADPLLATQLPRFRFSGVTYGTAGEGVVGGVIGSRTYKEGSQAETYSKVFVPELVLTQSTLREQLQRIGDVIHGEPRVDVVLDPETSDPIFEVSFDLYGDETKADVSGGIRVYNSTKHSINGYCTEIRSNASNLTNSLRYDEGSVDEPAKDGYTTVRTETANLRVDESNAFIPTSYPIYRITKAQLSMSAIVEGVAKYASGDVTNYILEKSAYDLLAEYDNSEIRSKSLALYYTQGQKNINGLFFRSNTLSDYSIFQRYAIVRVLAAAANVAEDYVESMLLTSGVTSISMQISYVPIYSNLISHSKQEYDPNAFPFAQSYSQSENLIESTSFGEHIKGVAARLGNYDTECTYIFGKHSAAYKIKPGMKLDDKYISEVRSEIYPTYEKTTLSLTANFNRISEFVGINSHKRVYEVSEKEAFERHILIKRKVILTNRDYSDLGYGGLSSPGYFLGAINRSLLEYGSEGNYNIGAVIATGYGNENNALGTVCLPVVASAFGNTLTFTWRYKDNYSAGTNLFYASDEKGVSGYWTNEVQYCDEFGQIKTYEFALVPRAQGISKLNYPDATGYPILENAPAIRVDATNRYWLKKDSREKLTFTVEYEFQTLYLPDVVIGSGFASTNPLVSPTITKAKLYILRKPLGKFQKTISASDIVALQTQPLIEIATSDDYNYVKITLKATIPPTTDGNNTYYYWAVATEIAEKTNYYKDDYGKVVAVSTQTGGEVLFFSTQGIQVGQYSERLKRDIYLFVQK